MNFFPLNFWFVTNTRQVMEHFKLVFGSGNSDLAKIRPLKVWTSWISPWVPPYGILPLLMSLFSTVTMDSASNFRTIWADEVKRREKKGGENTVLSFGQPLQPRRRGGCLSKPQNHHQLTCKAILHHHDRLFKRPQGFL